MAKSRLQIAWDTARSSDEKQLSEAEVVEHLRGDDKRPLLVLRDCGGCDKKVDDLVNRTLANEQVILASQWFHCVRVSKEAADPRHPFHALFEGTNPPHIIMTSWSGSKLTPRLATTADKVFWKEIVRVLRVDYRKNPTKHVRDLQRALDKFDMLQAKRDELTRQLAAATEKKKAARQKRLEKKLAEVEQDLAKAAERETKLKDLGLRNVAKKIE